MRDRELIERLRSSAKAFRKHPIYTSDGDPVLLTVQADECDAAADRLEAQAAEIERLREVFKVISGPPERDPELPPIYQPRWSAEQCRDIARQALQQGQNNE